MWQAVIGLSCEEGIGNFDDMGCFTFSDGMHTHEVIAVPPIDDCNLSLVTEMNIP